MGTKLALGEEKFIKDFIAAIEKNPTDALSPTQLEAVRKQLPSRRWCVISICNAIGSVYQNLSREHKDLALDSVLNYLSSERWDVARRDIASVIDDALLLADVCIASDSLYWPDFEQERILRDVKNFDFTVVKEKVLTPQGYIQDDAAHSEFILTYGLLRSDRWSYNEEFAKALNPKVLGYTVRGIVWQRFGRASTEKTIERGRTRLEELLPKCVHAKIEPIRKAGGWVTNPELLR